MSLWYRTGSGSDRVQDSTLNGREPSSARWLPGASRLSTRVPDVFPPANRLSIQEGDTFRAPEACRPAPIDFTLELRPRTGA
jgi:hypothetical protein